MAEITQKDVEAAAAAAVAAARTEWEADAARNGELTAVTAERDATAEQLAEQTAAAEALQAQLDAAQADLAAARTELDAAQADLQAAAERDAERDAAARRDGRVAEVKAAKLLPDDYVEAQADRIAAMDDEAFETFKADLAARNGTEGDPLAAPNPFQATATPRPGGAGNGSVLGAFSAAARSGTDFSRLPTAAG